MRNKISLLTLSIAAAAALTKCRFCTAAGAVASAAGNAVGVVAEDTASGSLAPVDVLGTAIVECGGNISAGAAIEVGSDGKAVTIDEGIAVARALEAGSSGDFIEVLLLPN